jgi:hypothetical protein
VTSAQRSVPIAAHPSGGQQSSDRQEFDWAPPSVANVDDCRRADSRPVGKAPHGGSAKPGVGAPTPVRLPVSPTCSVSLVLLLLGFLASLPAVLAVPAPDRVMAARAFAQAQTPTTDEAPDLEPDEGEAGHEGLASPESDGTAPDDSPTKNTFKWDSKTHGPQKVNVGFYLLNGGKLDFVNSCLALDFYLWFTFTSTDTPSFEFLNCKNAVITKQEEQLPYPGTDLNYVVFRVNGTFDQTFDLRNYPFDRFVIKILLEDTEKNVNDRIYAVDEKESGVDPMFQVMGWNMDRFEVRTLVHPYNTTFGVPESVDKEAYSQAEVSVAISRNHLIIFVKMVMPAVLFLLISVMSILLPIEQISQKISLCVAALFSSVAYHLSLSQGLPQISYLTFVDKMMLGNYFTIFINLIFTILIFLADKAEMQTAKSRLMVAVRIVVPVLALTLVSRLVIMGFSTPS